MSSVQEQVQVLKEEGNTLFKNKQFDQAIEKYNKAIDLQPDAVFYSNRSACYQQLKLWEKVIEDCTAALKLRRDYLKVWRRRALAHKEIGDYEECSFDWLIVSYYETDPKAKKTAQKQHSMEMSQATQMICQKMEKERPKLLQGVDRTLELIAGFPEDTEALALLDVENLVDGTGDDLLFQMLKKLNENNINRYQEAEELVIRALSEYKKHFVKHGKSPELTKKLAVAAEYNGLFKYLRGDSDGISEIETAASWDPTRARNKVVQALTLIGSQKFEEAEKMLLAAEAMRPNAPEVHYYKAKLYDMLCNDQVGTQYFKNSKESYQKFMDLWPENSYPYSRMISFVEAENDEQLIKKLLERGEKYLSEDPGFLNLLAERAADEGRSKEAVAYADKAIINGENWPTAIMRTKQLCNRAGMVIAADPENPTEAEFAETEKYLQKAYELDPRAEEVIVMLAQVRLEQAKYEEAIEWYGKAIEIPILQDEKTYLVSMALDRRAYAKVMIWAPEFGEEFLNKDFDEDLMSGNNAVDMMKELMSTIGQ